MKRLIGLACGLAGLPILLAAAGLEVARASLHQYEGGPPLGSSARYQAGETLFATVQVSGYRTQSDGKKILLSYEMEAVDSKGVLLDKTIKNQLAAELQPEDKDWLPLFREEIVLPQRMPTGTCRLRLRVKDETGGATTQREVPFLVQGQDVEPSSTLTVRNPTFYRDEEGTQAVPDKRFAPGSTIYGRFDITGYKHGPDNRFSVQYGMQVKDGTGRVLLARPDAATLSDSSFYPQPFVPGGFQFSTPPTTKPGPYTVTLTLKDEVGQQTAEQVMEFQVQ